METAKIAAPISGSKLYQERAREVLPLLVRQAHAGKPIFYSDLATEVGMPNPRNLNYVLWSIGTTMENLSKGWRQKVPPIQCLVINKKDELPGEGVGWFLEKSGFKKLDKRQKRAIVEAEQQHIFAYQRWEEVLSTLALEPSESDFSGQVERAAKFGGGGESEGHKRLKRFLAKNPELVGVRAGISGRTEVPLASGDCLDVYFVDGKHWVAVEAKSRISAEPDVTRGIFQCVKYRAVLEAMQAATGQPQNARALLAIEGALSAAQISLKNLLGVEVIENVRPDG